MILVVPFVIEGDLMVETAVRGASLKQGNAPKLFALLAANALFFYLLVHSDQIGAGNWPTLASSLLGLLPAGVGVALVGILNGQISGDMKAKLAFLRWNFPYPGCRAFSYHGPKDLSVDMATLERRHGHLPTDPREQNVLWYRMYRAVAGLPGVAQAHRHFLFARDYAFMSLVMLVVLGGAAGIMMKPVSSLTIYVLLLLVQWAFATNAASVGGQRFVTIVLAQNAAHQ